MGKRGPAKLPTAYKQLEGTYREDRDGGTLRLRPGIPARPLWLDGIAANIWDETIAELSMVEGLLSDADGPALALYCDAWRQYHEYDQQLRKDGNTTLSLTAGVKAHPLIARRDAAREAVIKIGAKFGLNPGDRASMKVAAQTTYDELSELIA